MGRPRSGPGQWPGHCGDHSVHAGLLSKDSGTEISAGMEQQGDRQASGADPDGGQQPDQPRPQVAPGPPARGGL